MSTNTQNNEPVRAESVVTLNGAQLLQALDFIAPDRDTDPQQLECELTISFADGPAGSDYYCYCTDYPGEGAIMLDAETADDLISSDKDQALTQQTLDDVKAGIPARDAEIEALRKEIETLKAAQAQPDRDAVELAREGMELHSTRAPEHIVCAELVRIAELAQQVDKPTEMQGKLVDNPLDLQGHASVIFAKAVAWADARVESALIQEQGRPHGYACDDAAQAHYELVQALRDLQEAQQPVSGTDGLPIELRGIAEAIGNGGGFWRSCSGCHELNEGMATGPFSETLKCNLGVGCSECGGIGAIWDTTDYDAMADFMAAEYQQRTENTEPVGQGQFRDVAQMIEPSGNSGELNFQAEYEAFKDAAWNKSGSPIGLMDGKNAAWWAWVNRAALAQQDAALQAEVLGMVRMLEVNEWADHCGKSELGKRLEWAITALQNQLQNIPKNIPGSSQQDTDKVDGALAEMVHAMFRSANSIPVTRITIDRKQYEAAIDAARKEQA